PDTLSIPNPNSGTDAVTMSNGTQVLVYNPTERYPGKWGGPRYPLAVATSTDGRNWRPVLTLETEPGEYSYPAIIETTPGQLVISYTWKREKIKVWKIEGVLSNRY
ncbi:MAG: exo-alpha-sialidase, partial [Chitinophagaceae bacterium]|nr:exo-alpha-sialidase [Chitinophagaceae bacterium]